MLHCEHAEWDRGVPPVWGSWERWSFVAGDHEPGLQKRRSSRGENCAARAKIRPAVSAYQGALWCRLLSIPSPASACKITHSIKHTSEVCVLLCVLLSWRGRAWYVFSVHTSLAFFCLSPEMDFLNTHKRMHTQSHTVRGCCRLPDDIHSSRADFWVTAHDWHAGSKGAIDAEDHTLHAPWQYSQVGLCTCLIPPWNIKTETRENAVAMLGSYFLQGLNLYCAVKLEPYTRYRAQILN